MSPTKREHLITYDRAQELLFRARHDPEADHRAVARGLADVVDQLHATRVSFHRSAPYPDCKLSVSLRSDGWHIGWQIQEGNYWRTLSDLLRRNEMARVAETAIQTNFGRSLLLDQFKMTAYLSVNRTFFEAQEAMRALVESYEKSIAELKKEMSDRAPDLPEATNAAAVVEGGPLPFEDWLKCRWCEDKPLRKKDDADTCSVCQGSGWVYRYVLRLPGQRLGIRATSAHQRPPVARFRAL